MTDEYSYLTKEQLRYIRRLSRVKTSQPEDIYHMIDLVTNKYNRDKNSNFGYNSWKKYEHDIGHILFNWRHLEVHAYVATLDPKFMKNLYASLENSGPESHYEQNAHNKRVYGFYLSIQDFIPTIRDLMVFMS